MTISIVNWNVAENVTWFVRIADNAAGLDVELYTSQANATAQANVQAAGTTDGYGSALDVTLTAAEDAAVTLWQEAYAWHLQVAGQAGDATKILRVAAFVDLEEIVHPLYREESLVTRRAAAEIDAHTHARMAKVLTLGVHLPALDVGDVLQITSARRSLSILAQVDGHTIQGDPDTLISEVTVSSYLELKR
jgi:hypothetical protein